MYMQDMTNIMIVTFDNASAASCLRTGMTCADGSPYATEPVDSVAHRFATREFNTVCWAKQRVVLALLQRNFTVLGMDTDVVTFRNIAEEVQWALQETSASALFLSEPMGGGSGYLNIINTGVFMVKPDAASMFEAAVNSIEEGPNQTILNNLAYKAYAFCEDTVECLASRRAGLVPVWRSPSLCPNGHSNVRLGTPDQWWCSDRMAYFHILCVEGWERKNEFWTELGLWLLDKDDELVQNSTLLKKCENQGHWRIRF
jgi:hypothetical protein